MKSPRLPRMLAPIVLWGAILWSGSAHALWPFGWNAKFGLGEWRGSLTGGYEFEDQQTKNGSAPEFDVLRNRYDELVELRNEGFYLIDPRLIDGVAGLDLDFFQETDRFGGSDHQFNGTLIGYDLSTQILPEKAYTGNVFANRHQGVVSTDFAGRTEVTTSTIGVGGKLREYSFLRDTLPYFSSTIGAREEEMDQTTKQFGVTYTLDDKRDVIDYRADKGFQTADLSFTYEYVNDRLTGTNRLAYQTHWFGINYSLDFGPNLNRRWDSRINYYTRSGEFNQSYLYADEMLRIDHFKNLRSWYQYLLSRIQTDSETLTNHTALLEVQHRLWQNLTTTAGLTGFYQTVPEGRRYYYAANVDHAYERSIPMGGTIYADNGMRYQIDDNSVTGGQISVVDEQHTAPSSFGPGIGFTLNNPFVITSTIDMFDTRGGGRIPTVLGVDYDIVAEGDLTQIVILSTTVVIQPGDPLEVSYLYQISPSARYRTTNLTTLVGVRFDWLDLSWQRQTFRQTLLSGGGGQFLYDLDSDVGHLELHRDWGLVNARAFAMYQIYDATFLSYKLQNYGEYIYLRPGWWGMIFGTYGNQSFTDFTLPKRRTSRREFGLTLERFSPNGSYLSLYGRMRTITDSQFPTENDLEAGMQGTWRYGKIEFVPVFRWVNRKWGPLKINDPHLVLRIKRSF